MLVPVPRLFPRFVTIPGEKGLDMARIEDIIIANAGLLAPRGAVVNTGVFRITLDGSLEIEEDEAGDLLDAVEEAVRRAPPPGRRPAGGDRPDRPAHQELPARLVGSGPGRRLRDRRPAGRLIAGRDRQPAGAGVAPVPRLAAAAAARPHRRRRHLAHPAGTRRPAHPPLRQFRPRGQLRVAGRRRTRACWPSSRRCTAPAATRRSSAPCSRPPRTASR